MAWQRIYPQKRNWENEPSTATPIDEDNLNAMDVAIYELDGRVVENHSLIEGLENYETRASEAAAAAEASEQAAAASETAAGLSEYNARQSELAAKVSEDAAALSETNAATSATNAAASATAAAASQVAAKTSEDNAKASELAAATSETNAATSETNAATSETNAATSESNAADSAELSRRWAVGITGSGVETPTDTNNSYYYSLQSKNDADRADEIATDLEETVEEINQKLELATFDVDANGNLVYDGGAYTFTVDNDGMLNWEVAA